MGAIRIFDRLQDLADIAPLSDGVVLRYNAATKQFDAVQLTSAAISDFSGSVQTIGDVRYARLTGAAFAGGVTIPLLGVGVGSVSAGTVFDVGARARFQDLVEIFNLSANAYYNAGWKYRANGGAWSLQTYPDASIFNFAYAPAGVAGNTVSWNYTGLSLDTNSGRVGIGLNAALGAQLHVQTNAPTTVGQIIQLSALHSTDVWQVRDSGGTVKLRISNDFRFAFGGAGSGAPALRATTDQLHVVYENSSFGPPIVAHTLSASDDGVGIRSGNGLELGINRSISFSQSGAWYDTKDLQLWRDAPGSLALRRGGTAASPAPQTIKLYSWTNGGGSYTRGSVGMRDDNKLTLSFEHGGTGTSIGYVQLFSTGSGSVQFGNGLDQTSWQIATNHLEPIGDAVRNLGNSSNRIGDAWIGKSLTLGGAQAVSAIPLTINLVSLQNGEALQVKDASTATKFAISAAGFIKLPAVANNEQFLIVNGGNIGLSQYNNYSVDLHLQGLSTFQFNRSAPDALLYARAGTNLVLTVDGTDLTKGVITRAVPGQTSAVHQWQKANSTVGFAITRDFALQFFDNGARPAAAEAHRGKTWTTFGASGVADTHEICLKNADGSYSWKSLIQ